MKIPTTILAVALLAIAVLMGVSYMQGNPFMIHGQPWGFTKNDVVGSGIKVLNFSPVVYSGTSGGEKGEYQLPSGGKVADYSISVPNLPTSAKIIGAWAVPYDNIDDVPKFDKILVEKLDDTHIRLQGASTGSPARVRLLIHVLYR